MLGRKKEEIEAKAEEGLAGEHKQEGTAVRALVGGVARATGGTKNEKNEKGRGGEAVPGGEGVGSVRLECMLASASADLTVRIWDLSFNPRIAR